METRDGYKSVNKKRRHFELLIQPNAELHRSLKTKKRLERWLEMRTNLNIIEFFAEYTIKILHSNLY